MDGTLNYEGVFVANNGKTPIPASELRISSDATNQSSSTWIRVNQHLVPLVFLRNGIVLIPRGAYADGMDKLKSFRQVQEN